MANGKLSDPRVQKKIIDDLAMGKSQEEIAAKVGVSQPSISIFKNKEEIKPFLEKQVYRLIELAPDAISNIQAVISDNISKIPLKDTRRRKFVFDASVEVLKGISILPSTVQNQTIINLYQNNLTLSPQIQDILQGHNKQLSWKDDAIDCEVTSNKDLC